MKFPLYLRVKHLSLICVALSFCLVSCNKTKVTPPPAMAPHGDPTPDPDPKNEQTTEGNTEDFESSFGVLNFRQLMATYSSLTGVSGGNPAVQAEYLKQIGSLPVAADAASISAAKVSASTKLAAVFCDQMSTDDNLLRSKFDLSGSDLAALESQDFSRTLVNGFFGAPSASQGDRSVDEQIITELTNTLRQIQPDNGPLLASSVFMGACSAIISSGEFTLY